MASTILGTAALLDDAALCAAAEGVDARRIIELVASAPRRLRERATAPNSAGVHEVFLDGANGDALMRWLDATAPDAARSVHALVAAAESAALATLGYMACEARSVVFGTRALLARLDAPVDRPAQPPHVDAKYGSAQFLVTLSRDAKPTLVYADAPSPLLRACISPHARLAAALLPLALPRAELEAATRPALAGALAPGAMLALAGPIIHAGPATAAHEDRVLFFMTCALPGTEEPYDQDHQLLPFIWHDEQNDFEGFVRSAREWASHEPWKHFWSTPKFYEAVRTLCKTGVASPALKRMFEDSEARS